MKYINGEAFLTDEEYAAIMAKRPGPFATQEEINRLDEEQADAYNNYWWGVAQEGMNKPEPDWNYWAGNYEKRIINWGTYRRPALLKESVSSRIDVNGDRICVMADVSKLGDKYFISPPFSVLLPPFNAKIAYATGYPAKEILIKRNIFIKNYNNHKELRNKPGLNKSILKNAIYNASTVIFNTPNKPNYRSVVKINNMFYVVNLDFTPGKQYTEVVGWYVVNLNGYNDMVRRAAKTNGYALAVD